MPPPDLAPDLVAGLPPQRPRWMGHTVAVLAVVAEMAVGVVTGRAGHSSPYPWSDTWNLAPVLVLLPFVWRTATWRVLALVALVLVPFGTLFWAGRAGYRMAALPYRDWQPRTDQRARVRHVPGTAYHVVLRADQVAPVPDPVT